MDAIFVSHAPTGHSRRVEGVRRLILSTTVAALFGTVALHGVAEMLDAAPTAFQGGPGPSVTSTPRQPMFELGDLAPGRTATAFTTVAYDGSAPGEIRLFAEVEDAGLARHLILTVTRGTGSGRSFVADADGTLFTGTLSAFPAGWAEGIEAGAPWDPGRTGAFRFDVRVAEGAPAGATADASFSWEARTT